MYKLVIVGEISKTGFRFLLLGLDVGGEGMEITRVLAPKRILANKVR